MSVNKKVKDPSTGAITLEQIAGKEANALEQISSLPTASASYVNKNYLLVSEQFGYQKGGIYQCQENGGIYSWVMVNGSGVVVDTVEDGNLNAVTSNAVADKFNTLDTYIEITDAEVDALWI